MEILSQRQLRAHGKPEFCYLCGEHLCGKNPTNSDHCPPKGLFAEADREDFPIILHTHEKCNNRWSGADDLIGIITDALHVKQKSRDLMHTSKLDAEFVDFGAQQALAVSNLPLAAMAARIVRGMHALLYNQFLPVNTKYKLHIPLPEADIRNAMARIPLEQAFVFSRVIGNALLTKTASVVRAYKGKFKYACTWDRLDDGVPFCITCFDIYNFHSLSPPVQDFPKVFIGMYIPHKVPEGAIWASRLESQFTQGELLDPWQKT